MSKLVSPVVVKKAKKEAIQPVDLVNVSQVRHLRLLERCQVVKKARFKREKTGSAKIKYQHRRKKTTKKKK